MRARRAIVGTDGKARSQNRATQGLEDMHAALRNVTSWAADYDAAHATGERCDIAAKDVTAAGSVTRCGPFSREPGRLEAILLSDRSHFD